MGASSDDCELQISNKMSDEIAGYIVNFRKRLGRGAIGMVYMARDQYGTPIAAKQVDKTKSERSAVRELENAQKQLKLQHENIVEILKIYNEEDVWVFMEFLKEGDLNNYSKNYFSEFQKVKLNIMEQILKGLDFLQSLRITHRDIKPENILIQTLGDAERVNVKLTDFGLAKFHDPEDPTSAMQTKVGTQNYMAPEFWNIDHGGMIEYHRSVDIFAAGLTFCAMLKAEEGKDLKPIADGCAQAELGQPIGLVMLNRFTASKPDLSVVTDAPDDPLDIYFVKGLIKKATAFNPDHRPTARQMQEILEVLNNRRSQKNKDASQVRH